MQIRRCFLLIAITVGFCLGLNAQIKIISIPASAKGDTDSWYKSHQAHVLKIGLHNLVYSTDSLHFRFSTGTQALDVWTNDFKTFFGTIANYTYTYHQFRNNGKQKPEKFYSKQAKLDTSKARRIYNVFTSLSVFSVPTDDSIMGWRMGCDGEEFIIECSTPRAYSFKTYWTPSAYKNSIPEAATIDSLANELRTTLQLRKLFDEFIDDLPWGCYTYGGIAIRCTEPSYNW